MKKVLVFGLAATMVLAVAWAQMPSAGDCGRCPLKSTVSCPSPKNPTAGTAQTPSPTNQSVKECAKRCGMTPEECAKLCGGHGNCAPTRISIQGMTCAGCEKSVSAALATVDGVKKVIEVSHKEGMALICTDPTKAKSEVLIAAVTDKGYKAEIVPAVAKTGDQKTCTGKRTCCKSGKKSGCPSMSGSGPQ